MAANNNGTLQGNLAADPEAGRGATAMARFRLAVDSYNSSTKSRETDFVPLVAFGRTAEFVLKYLKKGSAAVVQFHVKPRSWTDANGDKKYETSIVADDVRFAGNKGGGSSTPSVGGVTEDEDDDPFALV